MDYNNYKGYLYMESQAWKQSLLDFELIENYQGEPDESPPQTIVYNSNTVQDSKQHIHVSSLGIAQQYLAEQESQLGLRVQAPSEVKDLKNKEGEGQLSGVGEIQYMMQALGSNVAPNKTVVSEQRSSSIKELIYNQHHCSISAQSYEKDIQVLLEKDGGNFLEKNQTLLKILFTGTSEEPIDEQRITDTETDPHVYDFFFLHSGVARFIELFSKEKQLKDKNSLDFCLQQRKRRQQFIYQLSDGETLHDDQQRIFLVDQSVESFKYIHQADNIKPQYEGQDVTSSLKAMKPPEVAHATVEVEVSKGKAMKIQTQISLGLVIGDRFVKKALLQDTDKKQRKLQKLMDLIFEHQMIQSLAYLDNAVNKTTNDLFVVSKGSLELIDYCCLKNKYFILRRSS
ncbi:hypothetical protein FGO68_gene3595 [Halteria grandinella]|uniref:Uncharacterized protein n=1 Tax=Halteria grandinella TaxID=5974 RepID=A0A8J8NZ75_HALGN|nr:hypothetical protein FGO68_gene3595 [Halteria grandinella]